MEFCFGGFGDWISGWIESAVWVVGIWLCGLGCGLWGPIKTNQGSGVTFGTCSLLRPLALYPESPICILPFAILFLSALVSEFMLP